MELVEGFKLTPDIQASITYISQESHYCLFRRHTWICSLRSRNWIFF